MCKIVQGDIVRFRGDKRRVAYLVLAVSEVYDMAKLENNITHFFLGWYPLSGLVKSGFYQPNLIMQGV